MRELVKLLSDCEPDGIVRVAATELKRFAANPGNRSQELRLQQLRPAI